MACILPAVYDHKAEDHLGALRPYISRACGCQGAEIVTERTMSADPICNASEAVVRPSVLLGTGIALRLITFIFLNPENSDAHSSVISFIAQQGRLPHSGDLDQAYQPPLYYLLTAPIYHFSTSFKIVQAFSLLLSILTLLVFFRLIYCCDLINNAKARSYGFALVCFLPQFIAFQLFVSNDTLTIFLGACTIWCLHRFARSPGFWSISLLALVLALGLLTKATFLSYLPVVGFAVLFMWKQRTHSVKRSLGLAFVFVLTLAVATSYKEIDNYRQYGRAFMSNIDFRPGWAIQQEQTYQGMWSYVNVDLVTLLHSPSLSSSTKSAYPLMLYATFWYQHIPESSFIGSSHRPFTFLAEAIYLLAIVPTTVFVVGMGTLTRNAPSLLRRFRLEHPGDCRAFMISTSVGLLTANLGIMLAAVVRYHVWSIMQGRLLFPSFFGIVAAFAVGVERVERIKWGERLLRFCITALCVLFVTYLVSEIGATVVLRYLPAAKDYLRGIT